MKYLILLPLCALSFALQQAPLVAKPYDPFHKKFSGLVRSTLDHFHVLGLSVSVVNDEDVFAKGYGLAKLPAMTAKPETLYFAGSTTKSFTAAVLTILMDDQVRSNVTDALTWSTPIVQVIRDDFVLQDDYVTTHTTLEDAASHRTGLGGHDLAFGGSGTSVLDIVRVLRNLPLTAEFRTTFQYNNLMWTVLQYIAEQVSGSWLGDLMQSRIWNPLKMTRTYFTIAQAEHAVETEGAELARGYFWDNVTQRQEDVPYYSFDEIAGCGAIISNVLDYAEYLKMMIHESKPVSKKGHSELRQARSIVGPHSASFTQGRTTYTLGWGILVYRGVEIMQHSGGLPGFGTFMAFVPSKKWGVTIMGNAATPANNVGSVLFFSLLDDLLDVPQDQRFNLTTGFDEAQAEENAAVINAKSTIFPNIPSPPLAPSLSLSAYTGTYENAGYQDLTFYISLPSHRIPGSAKIKNVLRANATHRTIPYALELEHISGESFLAWLLCPKNATADGPGCSGIDNVKPASPAEFHIAANGLPDRVGIALESTMNQEDKIWFQRK